MLIDGRKDIALVRRPASFRETKADLIMAVKKIDNVMPADRLVWMPVRLAHDPTDPAGQGLVASPFELCDQFAKGQRCRTDRSTDEVSPRRPRERG
ncbi:hypothetical protein [Roseicyclus elongatus]|uniref:hypothetical protein n=1 Tax=Roseicyclus elongatus TaxID=159346 RepID=UPI0012EBF528|nr:hypothetical protein [Roseibacterium elongatum]